MRALAGGYIAKKKETGSSGLLQVYIQLSATAANESLGQSEI